LTFVKNKILINKNKNEDAVLWPDTRGRRWLLLLLYLIIVVYSLIFLLIRSWLVKSAF